MRSSHPLISLLGLVVVMAGCQDTLQDPTGPSDPRAQAAASQVTVMSRNMYVGADVDAVIFALATPDPGDDLPALLTAISTLQATDFPARAAAMADEIARERPHVVGLQEVSEIEIDLTALGIPVDLHLAFLPVLLGELSARGLDYEAGAVVENLIASPMPGIRLVDYDVLLVDRTRVMVTPGSIRAKRFDVNIGTVAPGVDLFRGWVAFDGTVGHRSYTFVGTHLESGSGQQLEGVRALQALELATATAESPSVILMGDLNDTPGSPMYQALAAAGFADVWIALTPGVPGLTCCHPADLSNAKATMTKRIDYIFARGVGHPWTGVQGRARLVGLGPEDRLAAPGPRWPSDHAGIIATLLTPSAGN